MKITVSNRITGKIKPMHGVGQPPFQGTDFSMISYLREAGIPFSRLHDVGGWFGGNLWADIPNIFRDFSADVNDPESYDFKFTDLLITALIENGVEPFFRLGVTIENFAAIKAYRIYPPADYQRWAEICEHIIRHYTEGWADGFKYNIRYWEIWNEPDNYEDPMENQMWRGTKEQYYELYGVASKHLKKCFPHLKIGGYASCGFYVLSNTFVKEANSSPRKEYFIEFFDGFLDYIKKNDCPLDFFSWHSYDNIENNRVYADYARKRLDGAGYTDTETTCNEWNLSMKDRGSYKQAALVAAMMLMFQRSPLDSAMFYDARFGTSIYGSLFDPMTAKPFPAYYAFTAFNRLYKLENELEVEGACDGVYAAAAKKDGKICAVIANTTDKNMPLELELCGKVNACVLTAKPQNESITSLPDELPKDSILVVLGEEN